MPPLDSSSRAPVQIFDPDRKIPGTPMPDLVVIQHSRIALEDGGTQPVYVGDILRGLDQANGWALVTSGRAMLATEENIAMANAKRDPWQIADEPKKSR